MVNRAAEAFRLGAQAVANSSSALGAYYRRMRARLDAPKAITATAHKLARIFYHLWKTHDLYHDPGADYYEIQYRNRIINNMKKRAKNLGFEITFNSIPNTQVS